METPPSIEELQRELDRYKQKELKQKEQIKKLKQKPEYKEKNKEYQREYQRKYYHVKKEEFQQMKKLVESLKVENS